MAKKQRKKSSSTSLPKSSSGFLNITSISPREVWQFMEQAFINGDMVGEAPNLHIESYVSIVLLCQLCIAIRSSAPSDLPESRMADYVKQDPAFKFYSNRLIHSPGSPGYGLAVMLAMIPILPYLTLDEVSPTDIWTSAQSSPRASAKAIPGEPTRANYMNWFWGKLNQIHGLIGSCISTNLIALGLTSETTRSATYETIFASLGFGETYKPADYLDITRHSFAGYLLQSSSGFEIKKLNFNTSRESFTPLETQLGLNDYVTLTSSQLDTSVKLGKSGALPDNALERTDVERYLNPLELLAYDTACARNMKDAIRDLTKKVLSRKQSKQTEVSKDQVSSDSPAPVAQTPTEPSGSSENKQEAVEPSSSKATNTEATPATPPPTTPDAKPKFKDIGLDILPPPPGGRKGVSYREGRGFGPDRRNS